MTSDNTFSPSQTANTVRAANGEVLTVPDGWVLLPPGDAGLTRRVKAAGEHWVVQEKKGRMTRRKLDFIGRYRMVELLYQLFRCAMYLRQHVKHCIRNQPSSSFVGMKIVSNMLIVQL